MGSSRRSGNGVLGFLGLRTLHEQALTVATCVFLLSFITIVLLNDECFLVAFIKIG
jgi:hypothetical protein